jgi:hypothetical protein
LATADGIEAQHGVQRVGELEAVEAVEEVHRERFQRRVR